MDFESEEQERAPKWKMWVLIFGGAILILIMAQAMKDAYELPENTAVKSKTLSPNKAIKVSASELQTQFLHNQDSALQAYKDKTVIVTGRIAEIDNYRTGESYVIFRGSIPSQDIDLQCVFARDHKTDTLHKGEEISVEGILNFVNDAIVLDKCQLIPE